jgi:Xaa-Pro dipeptidase
MRPTAIGGATTEQREVARRLIEIQDEQWAAMRPGVVAREVDRICREQVLAAGLRAVYLNATGYTLGFVGVPRTSDFTRVFLPSSDWVLEQGMVFHMYTWAQGMTFSDTILVTGDGHERLTQVERTLFER